MSREKSRKINKDGVIKQIPIHLVDWYINQGWSIGTGRSAWNKGLDKTDPRVAKYVLKMQGRKMSEEQKLKLSKISKGRKWKPEAIAKRTQTRKEKHFTPSKEQREKVSKKLMGHMVSAETRKKLSLKNKGKSHPLSEETKRKISEYHASKEFQEHQRKVKTLNHSFNSSKGEEHANVLLKELLGEDDVIRHYYDSSRYPFECDFYIKSLDIFIELNYHFTHNTHPFDSNNPEDILTLNKMKAKPQTRINSKGKEVKNLYAVAINVWTKRDVEKLRVAKLNNLNYKVFYNEKEFMFWYNNYLKHNTSLNKD